MKRGANHTHSFKGGCPEHYLDFIMVKMEEQSLFVSTFGDYPLIRILDFLIYSRDFDYPITNC